MMRVCVLFSSPQTRKAACSHVIEKIFLRWFARASDFTSRQGRACEKNFDTGFTESSLCDSFAVRSGGLREQHRVTWLGEKLIIKSSDVTRRTFPFSAPHTLAVDCLFGENLRRNRERARESTLKNSGWLTSSGAVLNFSIARGCAHFARANPRVTLWAQLSNEFIDLAPFFPFSFCAHWNFAIWSHSVHGRWAKGKRIRSWMKSIWVCCVAQLS